MRVGWRQILWLASGLASLVPASAHAIDGEFFAFPVLQAEKLVNTSQANNGDRHDSDVAIDLFYSRDSGKLLSLVEYFLGQDEQELERFQLGFSAGEASQVWFGRYHSPLSYWNTAYHHGRFLQPTIANPAIIDFEDEGGPLPTHLSGVLLDMEHFRGDQVFSLDAGVGLGPTLTDGELEPLDLLRPRQGEHSLAGALRVSMESLSAAYQLGISTGYARIDREAAGLGRIKQAVAGGFAHWEPGSTTLSSEIFVVRNKLQSSGQNSANTFVSGYLQGVYHIGGRYDLYLRLENTWNKGDDLYLQQLDDFVDQKQLLGARVYVTRQQALNLEYARSRQSGDRFGQWLLQWSAAFP